MSRTTPEHVLRSLALDSPGEAVWSVFRDHADPSALRALLDRLGPRLFERCRLITSDPQLAEDAVQDALVRLYASRHHLPTYPQAVAWLYRTATNSARHITRSRRRAGRRERVAGVRRAAADADLIDGVCATELAAVLARAVIDLPENERRAVELVYFEQMTHTAAAAALGWSRGSVSTYVSRGLRRLREGLSRRGLVVAAVPVLEAALGTAPPLRATDWSAVLPRVLDAVDAGAAPSPAGGLLAARPWWGAGLAAATGVGLTFGLWGGPPERPADPPHVTAEEVEPLAARNERLFRRDVLPELLAELARMLPPDNPPRLVGVTAVGPTLECEFVTTRAFLPVTRPTGLRFRYCTVRRRMEVFADLHGRGVWTPVDPNRPIIFDLAIPGLPAVELGQEGYGRGRKTFGKLPTDDRAEAELVRMTFGEPGDGFTLPPNVRAVAGDADRLVVTTGNDGLFDWNGRAWRYRGECHGWFLAAADDRFFCDRDGLWSRPVRHVDPQWVKVSDRPPENWKAFRVCGMAVAGGRVHYTVHRHPDGATAVWSRPLDDPNGVWARNDLPVHPGVFTGAGDWLYAAGAAGRLARRPAADAAAPWETIGRLPAEVELIQAAGQRLLAFERAGGPIHARSLTDPDSPWVVIGQVRASDPGTR